MVIRKGFCRLERSTVTLVLKVDLARRCVERFAEEDENEDEEDKDKREDDKVREEDRRAI